MSIHTSTHMSIHMSTNTSTHMSTNMSTHASTHMFPTRRRSVLSSRCARGWHLPLWCFQAAAFRQYCVDMYSRHVYGRVYGRVYGLVHGHVHGHVNGHVCGHVHGHVYGHVYRHVYGRVHGHMHRRVHRHMHGDGLVQAIYCLPLDETGTWRLVASSSLVCGSNTKMWLMHLSGAV